MGTNQPGDMATSDRHFGQNQGGSTRRTESSETNPQQNHQASLKSETNRIDPESEQYTNLSLEPKPQRPKESKKRDASRVEKQPSQISVASIFQKQKETSSGGD